MTRTAGMKRRTSAAPRPRAADHDLATKERLLQEATRLFAERGFQKVTVRDICTAAHANVAAVNYHFGGKPGLYDDVLRAAIRVMQSTTDEIARAGAGRPPEQQLTQFIHIFLQRVLEGRNGWIHRLMMHETQNPTPALDLVVDAVIRPRLAYLGSVIAVMMGRPADDPRVRLCVASVQTQCLMLMRDHPIGEKLGFLPLTLDRVPDVARHIAAFSIGGIKALAASS
jgi:TetR/AcrR family transcriptional regulator, regulator of cefoperazone and chloramphenicol sensitivity